MRGCDRGPDSNRHAPRGTEGPVWSSLRVCRFRHPGQKLFLAVYIPRPPANDSPILWKSNGLGSPDYVLSPITIPSAKELHRICKRFTHFVLYGACPWTNGRELPVLRHKGFFLIARKPMPRLPSRLAPALVQCGHYATAFRQPGGLFRLTPVLGWRSASARSLKLQITGAPVDTKVCGWYTGANSTHPRTKID